MNDAPILKPVPAGWLEAFERGEAPIAAGQTVSGDDVIRACLETIAGLEAKSESKAKPRTTPRR